MRAQRNRPNPEVETASKSFGGDENSVTAQAERRRLVAQDTAILTDDDGRPARVVQDMAGLDAYTRAVYFEGREDGRVEGLIDGYAAGWKASDDDAECLHREAFRIVRIMAGLPERDAEADRAAAERRAANYSQPVFGARQ